jgi:hypothetical protein
MSEVSLEGLSAEQINNLASLAKSLGEDPKTRRSFQRLIKEKNPATIIPELDAEDAITKTSEQLRQENEAIRQELTNDRIARQRQMLQARIEDSYPGMKFDDVEKAMTDHGIANHETAAKFLFNERKLAEPAAEIPGRGGPMMMPNEAKAFFKSPTTTARKLAHDAMTDIINQRARARAA